MSDWISTAGGYPKGLPILAFPLEAEMPEVYLPQSTILRMPESDQIHAYLWCYLERKATGSRYLFNPSSLAAQRVNDMPRAIARLSKRFRFDNARPMSVTAYMQRLSKFLHWVDELAPLGQYESILSDPELALDALKKHHSYLRQRMQANHTGKRIKAAVASVEDFSAIKMMSVIHDREYGDEIEVIRFIQGEGVKVPPTEDVAAFMACVQGVFDSVTRIVLDRPQDNKETSSLAKLSWQSGGQELAVAIPAGTHVERVMELGCVAYAALCVGDSGANLASIQSYEEPEDMQSQLDNPKRLSLRQKVIKFRAGGKEVPVHLTSTTVTRLRHYLRLREALRMKLDYPDINPLFIQCQYKKGAAKGKPLGIIPLERSFTAALRGRFRFVGINLPRVTMQQLRAHKQGKVAKEHNPTVAADMMGNSVSTAIRKYNKITAAASRSEIAPFLASLTSIVLTRQKESTEPSKPVIKVTAIPAGACADYGHPEALADDKVVAPDCKKTEGCFFCNKYHVHADEEDSIKLMSCRSVLDRLAPRVGDSGSAELVYRVVIDRIGALLNEIKRIKPEAHERARVAVLEEGRLSRYWASKLQQLHLLGLLTSSASTT